MSKQTGEYNELADISNETILISGGEIYRPSDSWSLTFRKTLRSSLKSVMPDKLLSFKAILAEAFLAVYGFDGYDPAKHEIATHKEKEKHYDIEELSGLLIIASFLGLPSRLPPEGGYDLDILTILRGFIGGWIPRTRVFDYKIWTKKDLWQRWAIPVKFLLILPLKLLTWPFKLFINLIKLVTEFLPKILELSFGVLLLQSLSLSIEASNKKKISQSLGHGLLSAFISLFYLSSFLLNFIGRMLTSPEKSASLMFHYFQSRLEKTVGKSWSTLIGVVFAGISVIYSIIIWAIVFPLAIGFITTHFPIVLQATAWMMQLPGVGAFLSFMNNVFLTIGSVTASFLNVNVVTLFSQMVGLQVSNTVLFLCAGIASLVTPVAIILTYLTDSLSNWWATKVNVYNTVDVVWLAVSKFQSQNFKLEDYVLDNELENKPVLVSSVPANIVDEKIKAAEETPIRENHAEATFARTSDDPTSPQGSSSTSTHVDHSKKSDAQQVTPKK